MELQINIKNKPLEYKTCSFQLKGIDEKGWVEFYPAVFDSRDRGKDLIEKGSFAKTIKENFPEIQHYRNHDNNALAGVIYELKEDNTGLYTRSKLILSTVTGMETYEEYKAMAEAGKPMPHSMGYITVKSLEVKEGRNLKELFLGEVSTLTKMAMNPLARNISVKDMSMDELMIEEKFYELLLNCKFNDTKLEQLELIKNHISALIEQKSRETTLQDNEPLVNWNMIGNLLLTKHL